MPYTAEDPFVTARTDSTGQRWWFRYGGGSTIRIRPAGADAGHWTHQIFLDDYGMHPDDVPTAWLQERATAWIKQYDEDMAAGLI
jgi:hypothetical protein